MVNVLVKYIINWLLFITLAFTCNYVFAQEGTKKKQKASELTVEEELQARDPHWMDSFHQTITNSVYQSASWFDNFFIEDKTILDTPTTMARIRLGWKPEARDFSEFEAKFRIKLKLPHLKNKVDLILSDDSEVDQSQLPLENTSQTKETNEESFTAALRFIHRKKSDRYLETRVGISGADLFARAKHKRRFDWSTQHGFSYEPSIYYFLDDGLGARLLLEYDYQLSEQTQFRVNYSIRGSESFSGIKWKHGFYQLKQIDESSASIIGLQVEGERNGNDGFFIDKYTLSYRYRFNALQKWLYFEIEPFLKWPEDENFTTTPGIALRVEGYFYKS